MPRLKLCRVAFLLVAACASPRASEPPHAKPLPVPDTIDFNRDVRAIISAKCFQCHGPDKGTRKAQLRLDNKEGATADLDGNQAIVPGNLAKSEMVKRMMSKDPEEVMPPPASHEKLSERDIVVLKKWIEQGAVYSEHWSFVKPVKTPLPKVSNPAWPKNAIDHFILARLDQEKLSPSPEAGRHALIRRVSLDLTGLPPTPREVDEFIKDTGATSYEKVVDRLMASKSFGERWARMWLDLARYADSAGYGSDPLRLNIWPYRDWLISAFNRNQPYDQFTIEQIAGDLLPNATNDQMLATAFHRNTMTNTEGGTDDEEFRVAAIKDRANTTGQVWMGLTVGCAQCHSHKFDPISQKEYYQFYALFNQTEDTDRGDEFPTMPMPTPSQQEAREKLQAQIAELQKVIKNPPPPFDSELAEWEKKSAGEKVVWTRLEPVEMKSKEGTVLTKQADGSVLAGGDKPPETDVYTISANASGKAISALRVDVLTHDSLPGKGPGRADGKFVLSDVKLSIAPEKPTAVKGRFVRVELPGNAKFLHMAEVQVFSGGQNIATKGKATQSSTDYDGPPNLANDGNTHGDYNAKSVNHTKSEDNPWWEVDLTGKDNVDVEQVAFWSRTDGGLHERMNGVKLLLLDAARHVLWQQTLATAPSVSVKLDLTGARELTLKNASADFSQPNFTPDLSIDGKTDTKTGWAVGGQTGKPHSIVYEVHPPLALKESESTRLQLVLSQLFGQKHTLGAFKVSVTDKAHPVKLLPDAVLQAAAVDLAKRSPEQKATLADHFRPLAPSLDKTRAELAALNKKLEAEKPVSVPVMREFTEKKRRVTKLLNKGNFLTPGDPVEPGLPAKFPLPEGTPMNRLGVAQWLVSRENPMTARVAANRFWAQLFGIGLTETEEDFGTQGSMPTHPELLDWMAVEFMDTKWDMKAFLKLLVTSATYRQSSRATPELLEKDPRNRLLARSPRRRLDAEQVRDQALALSGLLSPKIGGPSVFPPQPDGLWRAAFNGERTWSTSQGEDKYRRGMYTFWRRTVPYPSMATFDAPSREICNIRRIATNTPLQAFVTLNDPVYVECAQSLARRLVAEGGATPGERATYGLKLVLARVPVDEQVKALVALYQSEVEHYKKNPDAAKKMATLPLGALPAGMNEAELAAWTVVANILLNLDGVLMKG